MVCVFWLLHVFVSFGLDATCVHTLSPVALMGSCAFRNVILPVALDGPEARAYVLSPGDVRNQKIAHRWARQDPVV